VRAGTAVPLAVLLNKVVLNKVVINQPDYFDVPVHGGTLRVGRWGSTGPTVLAAHGITASHMAWLEVAGQLPGLTLIAPDLRGRGRSSQLPGPYDFDAHVSDLVAVLDAVGATRVVVAGHSMGGFVAVRLAGDHPERVSRLVLVDGGLPLGEPDDPLPPGGLEAALGPAAARLAMTFADQHAYHDFWRAHPAVGPVWGPSVEAYVDYDLVGEPPEMRSSCNADAVRINGAEVLDHTSTAAALRRVVAPTRLLRAVRGLLDGAPFYGEDALSQWLAGPPAITVSTVADTNHYSLVLAAPGAAAVAQAIAGD
jgi:lipase